MDEWGNQWGPLDRRAGVGRGTPFGLQAQRTDRTTRSYDTHERPIKPGHVATRYIACRRRYWLVSKSPREERGEEKKYPKPGAYVTTQADTRHSATG